MLSCVASAVNLNSHSTSFWQRDVEGVHLIGPCIHILLSMSRIPAMFEHEPDRDDLIAREAVRLAGLTLMSGLKKLFSFFCSELLVLRDRLTTFLSFYIRSLHPRYQKLMIWAAVTACLLQEGGEVCTQNVLRDICHAASMSVEAVIDESKRIVWISALMSPFKEVFSLSNAAESI